jgi:hypothetical protein
MKMSLVGQSVGLALALTLVGTAATKAADSQRLITIHAAFFSSETKQPKPVDPHVFVQDPASPAATGPQNIQHVAGVRPALIEEHAKTTPLFNAKGESLGFDFGQWLAANGRVAITPSASSKAKISAQFSKLRPGGSYSLFENHFDQQPVGFTPLDGAGKANNFVANRKGAAEVTLTAPQMLTHANAVLLVYHSDKTFHGDQRGEIGVTAHHQLIARIPE